MLVDTDAEWDAWSSAAMRVEGVFKLTTVALRPKAELHVGLQ